MIKGSTRTRVLIGVATIALAATACTSAASSAPSGGGGGGAKSYTIGFSNPGLFAIAAFGVVP